MALPWRALVSMAVQYDFKLRIKQTCHHKYTKASTSPLNIVCMPARKILEGGGYCLLEFEPFHFCLKSLGFVYLQIKNAYGAYRLLQYYQTFGAILTKFANRFFQMVWTFFKTGPLHMGDGAAVGLLSASPAPLLTRYV